VQVDNNRWWNWRNCEIVEGVGWVGTRHTRKGMQNKKSKVDVKYVDVYNDQLGNKTRKKQGGHLASIREMAA
jgi:hypothetical protein